MTKDFSEIWGQAVAAGAKALKDCKPHPVAFAFADLSDRQLGPAEICDEGDCGGAYIKLPFQEFVRWAKKNAPEIVSKDVYPGFVLSTSPAHGDYNGQSAERYEACADAMVAVLKANGVKCRTCAYLT